VNLKIYIDSHENIKVIHQLLSQS